MQALDELYLESHKKTLRERLFKLFNFYCEQQKSLGQGPTFDRILQQGVSMNIGKFMQFCSSTSLFKLAKIPR